MRGAGPATAPGSPALTLMVTFPLVIFRMLNPTVGIMSSLNCPDWRESQNWKRGKSHRQQGCRKPEGRPQLCPALGQGATGRPRGGWGFQAGRQLCQPHTWRHPVNEEAYQSLYQDLEDTLPKPTLGTEPLCWTRSPVERNAYLPAELSGPPRDSQVSEGRQTCFQQDGNTQVETWGMVNRPTTKCRAHLGGGSPPVCPLLTA